MNNLAVTLLAAVLALSATQKAGASESNCTQAERTACMHDGAGQCLKLKGAKEQWCMGELTQHCAPSPICSEPPKCDPEAERRKCIQDTERLCKAEKGAEKATCLEGQKNQEILCQLRPACRRGLNPHLDSPGPFDGARIILIDRSQ